MTKLRNFAEALSEFILASNQYLLVRLADIDDSRDLSVLKKWMSRQAATQAHRMLEKFRDSAVREQAVRQVSMRTRYAGSVISVTSSMDYQVLTGEEQT